MSPENRLVRKMKEIKKDAKKDTKEIQSNMERIYPGAVRVVLFDMDNTLFDFVAAKLIACREILSYIAEGEENIAEDPLELFEYFLRGISRF